MGPDVSLPECNLRQPYPLAASRLTTPKVSWPYPIQWHYIDNVL
jgi:hypothetical protein